MGETHLEVRDVLHFYGKRKVLDIPRLLVKPGEILVILGPNGAGKSALLRILNLLEKPSRGEIYLNQKRVKTSREVFAWRRRMAMAFQDPLLFNASVFDNVAYGLRVRKYPSGLIKPKVEAVLERLGIPSLTLRSALKLSGGEARRVSLARALVLEPEIFFLDEPLASLDQPTRERLQEDLKRVLKERNQTTVYVTHDQTEALTMADRLGIMHQGRILQQGLPEEVFNSPINEWAAGFVGMETVLSGTVISKNDGLAQIKVGNKIIKAFLSPPINGKVVIGIRPEEVTLFLSPPSTLASNAQNIFEGRITKITPQGYLAKIHLDCDFPLISLATKGSLVDQRLEKGKAVSVSFKATAVRLISA